MTGLYTTEALANNSGISTSHKAITCFLVNTATRLTKQYGAQLSIEAITDMAVMRTSFISEFRCLNWISTFPGTTFPWTKLKGKSDRHFITFKIGSVVHGLVTLLCTQRQRQIMTEQQTIDSKEFVVALLDIWYMVSVRPAYLTRKVCRNAPANLQVHHKKKKKLIVITDQRARSSFNAGGRGVWARER